MMNANLLAAIKDAQRRPDTTQDHRQALDWFKLRLEAGRRKKARRAKLALVSSPAAQSGHTPVGTQAAPAQDGESP